jgi:hypothetical protein
VYTTFGRFARTVADVDIGRLPKFLTKLELIRGLNSEHSRMQIEIRYLET